MFTDLVTRPRRIFAMVPFADPRRLALVWLVGMCLFGTLACLGFWVLS